MTLNRPAIDWALLAGLATGRLGWSPDCFWTSTPVELACALRGYIGVSSQAAPSNLQRQEFNALAARFPDH